MIRFKAIVIAIISGVMLVSCVTFIRNDDLLSLKNYEKGVYSLKEDVGEGKFALKKKEKVKLHFVTGDDFIKAYCYPADVALLKSERTLLVYLFEDDFEKKKFNIEKLNNLLFKKVEPLKK
ncbi:MAG: type II secretion system-associated lipoprotein [Spirochaetes bacterium]|nr:type II secretion system-associated lipoprotein [Spirochaetota bacterium]